MVILEFGPLLIILIEFLNFLILTKMMLWQILKQLLENQLKKKTYHLFKMMKNLKMAVMEKLEKMGKLMRTEKQKKKNQKLMAKEIQF